MNPLLSSPTNPMRGMMNGKGPINNFMQFMNDYKRLKQNPSELGQYLLEKGKINNNQLQEINKMNGDPGKIGSYLMQSGSIPQNQVSNLQNAAPQMQQYMNGFYTK